MTTSFCVLAMKSPTEGFFDGFEVVGPFPTETAAGAWGDEHLDNPSWVVAPMSVPA